MLVKNKKQKEINIFENVPKISDLLIPDELQEKVDYLKLGYNKFTRIFVMTIYPEIGRPMEISGKGWDPHGNSRTFLA